MSVRLPITVSDITLTLAAGYNYIKVYRSPVELTDFFEITTPTSRVLLQAGTSDYEFIDHNGTTEHWYRVTFYNSNLPAESAYSVSFKGDYVDSSFATTDYPEEGVYTSLDRLILDKVRVLVGDRKELTRDYVSSATGYSSISEDGYTHTLSNPKGWPVKVVLDGDSYTSSDDPHVNGYQFITFSGTQVSTTSGTLDVWYYHFRFSDSEVLRTYNGITPPHPLTADEVTFDLSILIVAIELLTSELGASNAESGSEVDIFEEIRINPKVGLDSRYTTLQRLIGERDALIDSIASDDSDVFGVRID